MKQVVKAKVLANSVLHDWNGILDGFLSDDDDDRLPGAWRGGKSSANAKAEEADSERTGLEGMDHPWLSYVGYKKCLAQQ